jgi:hypothetical protein
LFAVLGISVFLFVVVIFVRFGFGTAFCVAFASSLSAAFASTAALAAFSTAAFAALAALAMSPAFFSGLLARLTFFRLPIARFLGRLFAWFCWFTGILRLLTRRFWLRRVLVARLRRLCRLCRFGWL